MDELISINIREFNGFGKDTANVDSLSMLNVEGDFLAFGEESGASDVSDASTTDWQLYNEKVAWPLAVNSKAAKADAKSAKVGPKSSKAGEYHHIILVSLKTHTQSPNLLLRHLNLTRLQCLWYHRPTRPIWCVNRNGLKVVLCV